MTLTLLESSSIAANSTSIALITIATSLAGLWIWSQQKPTKSFPPGPKGWPLIGNLLEFAGKKPPHIVCQEYAEKYGNIFSLRIGQRWTVVLNGSAVIKEALLKKGVEFANRPTSYTTELFTNGGKDIVFGQYSASWKLHRKLAHSAFRTLASGNNARFEKLVYSVLPGLMESLDSKCSTGESFSPRQLLASTVYNIIATLCFGKQYEMDGPEIKNWMKIATEGTELLGNGLVADYIPALKNIPTSGQRVLKKLLREYFDMIDAELEEHRKQYKGGEPKDIVEMLFQARQDIIDEGKEDISLLTETHIRQTVADIFSAGSDTTILTMHWSIGILSQFPEVQEKVAEEVDRVVGRDRIPVINDRDSLPYTVAALYEVMRYSSLVPLSVPHATSKDVEFGGFNIPEGTWVLVNLFSMHFDEKLWDEPYAFKPEHFLDDASKVRLHPEGFLPFSTGRRVCLGESVAKAELFLLFSWLFQHYRFSKAPGFEDTDYSVGTGLASVMMPQDHPVVVEKRF